MRLAALIAALSIVVPNVVQADVTFADGQLHTIDAANSFPAERVEVLDGPGGSVTTVELVDGGEIGTANSENFIGRENSILSMTGGTIGRWFVLFGAASGSISGGSLLGGAIIVDTTSLVISGGNFYDLVHASNQSSIEILAGNFIGPGASVSAGYDAVIDIRGGSIAGRVEAFGDPQALVNIHGGTISGGLGSERTGRIQVFGGSVASDSTVEDDSEVSIFGGTVGGNFTVSERATLRLVGGLLTGTNLDVLGDSTAIIVGSGFNFPLGEIPDLYGTLTGTLSTGDSITFEFLRATDARIILAAVSDFDGDGIIDGLDNCFDVPNGDQEDSDGNGVGDACNDTEDLDGDDFADSLDNCPNDPNPGQEDSDLDLIGDACDAFPNDQDNEQAQCELDLASCTTALGSDECQLDLAQSLSDLGQCELDLGSCTGGLGSDECGLDLAQALSDLDQCELDLSTYDGSLQQAEADLAQALSDNDQCDSALTTCSGDWQVCDGSLLQAQTDLAQCTSILAYPDSDLDGARDSRDMCAGTTGGEAVSADGCTLAQFCARVDVTVRGGSRLCKKSDWQNDEPVMRGSERDCMRDRNGPGRGDDTCVPVP